MKINSIYLGDNISLLSDNEEFPDASVDCVVTSPPYFNQRDYNGVGMGNEATVEEYMEKLFELFDQLYRVTKSTGTIVINLGDKYIDGSLQLLPYRFAIALIDRYQGKLRLINDLTWVKPNPTPRQDKTKLISSTEPFFIFAKTGGYYFDKTAFLAVEIDDETIKRTTVGPTFGDGYRKMIDSAIDLSELEKSAAHDALDAAVGDVRAGVITGIRMKIRGVHALAYGGQEGGRNNAIRRQGFSIIRLKGETMKRDVIEQTVETIKGNEHPAVYPVKLIEEVIKLLTPPHGIVIDPFMGSGTTALAARNTERKYIGIEIDPEYHAYSTRRISDPLFD